MSKETIVPPKYSPPLTEGTNPPRTTPTKPPPPPPPPKKK